MRADEPTCHMGKFVEPIVVRVGLSRYFVQIGRIQIAVTTKLLMFLIQKLSKNYQNIFIKDIYSTWPSTKHKNIVQK